MAGNILVVGNGDWEENQFFNDLLSKSDLVIALDGAADRFDGWHEVIGDMDSIKNSEGFFKDISQDNSDLSKALSKYKVNRVFGIDGGRLDHRIGAFTSLFETKSDAILYFDGWRACRVPDLGLKMALEKNSNCALFAFGTVESVSIIGTEFELQNQNLETGTLGLGNRVKNHIVEITKSKGDLLFIWEENERV